MNIAKSYDFFRPEDCHERIHIIGCGAIGSTLAENLVRYGLTDITLYDMDVVQSHNVANQLYTEEDIGYTKVEALKRMLLRINPELESHIRLRPDGWHGDRLTGYVFLCVDSIDLRRQIATANRGNPFIRGMFDFRMGLTDAQHYAADWSSTKMVNNFISSMQFTSEEAQADTPVSACNLALSVCSTVRLIVALGVANFVNFVKTSSLKQMVTADAFAINVNAF